MSEKKVIAGHKQVLVAIRGFMHMGLTFCIKNDIFLCIYTCFSE